MGIGLCGSCVVSNVFCVLYVLCVILQMGTSRTLLNPTKIGRKHTASCNVLMVKQLMKTIQICILFFSMNKLKLSHLAF